MAMPTWVRTICFCFMSTIEPNSLSTCCFRSNRVPAVYTCDILYPFCSMFVCLNVSYIVVYPSLFWRNESNKLRFIRCHMIHLCWWCSLIMEFIQIVVVLQKITRIHHLRINEKNCWIESFRFIDKKPNQKQLEMWDIEQQLFQRQQISYVFAFQWYSVCLLYGQSNAFKPKASRKIEWTNESETEVRIFKMVFCFCLSSNFIWLCTMHIAHIPNYRQQWRDKIKNNNNNNNMDKSPVFSVQIIGQTDHTNIQESKPYNFNWEQTLWGKWLKTIKLLFLLYSLCSLFFCTPSTICTLYAYEIRTKLITKFALSQPVRSLSFPICWMCTFFNTRKQKRNETENKHRVLLLNIDTKWMKPSTININILSKSFRIVSFPKRKPSPLQTTIERASSH